MLKKVDSLILAGKHKEAFDIYYTIAKKHPISKEAHIGILKCALALKYYRHSLKTIFLLNGLHPDIHLGHSLFLLKNSLLTRIANNKDNKLLDFAIEVINKSTMISSDLNLSAFLELQSDLVYTKGDRARGLALKNKATIQKIKSSKNITDTHTRFSQGKLPDFLILGAQKTGTTALYEFLTKHPMVYPALRKELFFFSNPSKYANGIDWYKTHFTDNLNENTLTVEATATYFNDYEACRKINEVLGKEIKKIFIFRNPSERAISDYYMKVREGYENRDIETALTVEIDFLQGLSEEELMETILKPGTIPKNIKGYVLYGMYFYYLKFWLECSSEDSIMIVNAEDLKNNHQTTLKNIFQFLNLDNTTNAIKQKNVNQGNYTKDDENYHKVQYILDNFYASHNEKYFNLLSKLNK